MVYTKFLELGGLPALFRGSKYGNDPSLQINKSRITLSSGRSVCNSQQYPCDPSEFGNYREEYLL